MNLLAYIHLRNIYRSTGVGRVARELTEHLALDPAVNLQILADRRDHATIIPQVGAPWDNFHYHLFNRETSRQQAMWFATGRPAAEDFWPEAEIVFCPAESYVPTRKARLVVTCHDMQLFEPGAHALTRNLLQQRFKWWLLFRKLARKVDLFHTISAYSAARMAHYFPQIRGRIAVIPNAVSQTFFEPAPASGQHVLDDLNLRQRPYIVVPGGLHFRKNAGLILHAWPLLKARFPGLACVVIGHNSPQYLAQAQALAPSLILAGFQGEAEFVTLYANAHAVWFPSRYEGFGMPVLEAMACGAPVVTSNSAAIPEIAGNAAAALLDPDKLADHVDALTALLESSTQRQHFAVVGRAHAAHYTWPRSTQLLTEAFRTLL